ncbi:dihydrofolate reductase family protein [Pseudonocardia sp. CA-107938]|uniref:dihydrofolate reductase family protein n=1 Tax=Pseudonocardia sp. CA-107938 TaxID=3240021 RepID=UPI003D950049
MRTLKAWIYMTLDGVVEAPETWVIPDAEMFAAQTAGYGTSDALLLGRRTYEVFAASWPQRGSDVQNADWMNTTRKYLASTTLAAPSWRNTTVLQGDVVQAVAGLKREDGKDITVNGSAGLLRTLLRAELVDVLQLYVHPLLVGSGSRLFDDAPDRVGLTLRDVRRFDSGIVALSYSSADTMRGEIR